MGGDAMRSLRRAKVGRRRFTPLESRVDGAWFQLLKLSYDEPPSTFAFNVNLRCYTQAPPQRATTLLPGKPGTAGETGKAGTVAAAAGAGADGAMSSVFSMVDSVRGNVKYHVNNAIDTVGDALEAAEERLKDAADDMTRDVKAMLAARTLSLREISARRVQYNRKLKWSSVLYQNLGWFLTAFTWIFGGYVIMAYGVLIYRYLGRPAGYCSPRHPTHVGPSYLESNGTL